VVWTCIFHFDNVSLRNVQSNAMMRMFGSVTGIIQTRGTRDHLAVVFKTTHRF